VKSQSNIFEIIYVQFQHFSESGLCQHLFAMYKISIINHNFKFRTV